MEQFEFPTHRQGFYEKYVKRLLDVLISATALLVLWPVLLLVALAVRVKLGTPVLFKQVRIGVNESRFTLVKFRSMRDGKDKNGRFLPDCERLTDFGRFLRVTSLDELPELFNILKGDMSLIGPRPLPEGYLPYYKQSERVRHGVRGGLTGLAQANGRNALSWDDRFALDVDYTQNISFRLDVSIFLKTIAKVLCRSDIGERGVSSPEDLDYEREIQPWYLHTHSVKE